MGSVSRVLQRGMLALAALLCLFGAPAWAQPPVQGQRVADQSRDQDAPGRARVEVMVVYANHGNQVDPRVSDLKRQLASLGFTGFQVLSDDNAQLAVGQDSSFNTAANRRVTVSLLSKTPENARVRIQWTREGGNTVDTTVQVGKGRSFTMAGPKYQEGKLVLIVTANWGPQQ